MESNIVLELYFSWKQEDLKLISIFLVEKGMLKKLKVSEDSLQKIEELFKKGVFPIPNPEGIGHHPTTLNSLPEDVQMEILGYEIQRAQNVWRRLIEKD